MSFFVNYFTIAWKDLVEQYPAGVIEVGISVFVSIFALIITSTILLLVDAVFPEFASRHKRQTQKKRPQGKKLTRCIIMVIFNIILAISTVTLSKLYFGWQFSPFHVD
jgi:hypothetical protein